MQDAYFAAAAASIFGVVSSGAGDTSALVEALGRAIDEGRLLYVPSAEAEAELIAGNRIDGMLPADNSEKTMVGVYVNDVTEGKLDYYAKLTVAATSDQCTATEPTFSTTATFASTLDPNAVEGLASYISPARFFPKGVIATELVLYGPVGSTFTGATVDGAPSVATGAAAPRPAGREGQHPERAGSVAHRRRELHRGRGAVRAARGVAHAHGAAGRRDRGDAGLLAHGTSAAFAGRRPENALFTRA